MVEGRDGASTARVPPRGNLSECGVVQYVLFMSSISGHNYRTHNPSLLSIAWEEDLWKTEAQIASEKRIREKMSVKALLNQEYTEQQHITFVSIFSFGINQILHHA